MHQIQDSSLGIWLKDLRAAAYDIEDVLDEFTTEILRQKVEGGDCRTPRGVVAGKISEIQGRLENITKERSDLRLGEFGDGPMKHVQFARETVLSGPGVLLGRDSERDELVVSLLASDDGDLSSNLSVLAIIGMGGIGKTTLAQLVYSDKKLNQHFSLKMWIYVFDDFDVKKLTREIMKSAGFNGHDVSNLDKLQNNLSYNLVGKRYILVLDDVWNENSTDWERLLLPLNYGASGSKVVVTTRNKNVATVLGSKKLIYLNGLSDWDCWLILKKYAFVDGNSDVSRTLEDIGKKIVKKLNSVPLAAKMVGGVLRSKFGERRWRDLLESELWELERGGEHGILPALELSYQHLPAHLKQCFAFCSLFPKGYKYEKTKLVRIWMAQGFIQAQRTE